MSTRFSPPNLRSVLLAALAALVVAACGGGTGGTGVASNPPTPGVSVGVITAKGSIFVNGIEFSTAGASIKIDDGLAKIDDNPAVDNGLRVGMVVKVRGTKDDVLRTGTATEVQARDILEGKIDNVDPVNKTITVMGQIVRIEDNVTRLNDDDLQKVFADATFTTIDIVEVHGFADDQIPGAVRATRVAKKLTGGEFESKGFVSNLLPASFDLSVTAGGAVVLHVNFSGGQLPAGTANGSFVEVKSTVAPVAGTITASLIHLEDKIGAAGEEVEVEGIVTSGTLASFVVNGQQVVTSASTLFEGGVAGDFAVGVALEAEGPLDANGAIAATKISFESNIKIEGDASGVGPTTLTVLGKTVAIDQFTRIDTPVANTDHVEVRAIVDRNGGLIATQIIRLGTSDPSKASLQGPVTAANGTAGTLTILSAPVSTAIVSDGSTQWMGSSSGNLLVDQATFFSQVNVNVTVVKVKWNSSNTALPIKEAEIELGN
jgi:uncharacterized protein DUF5666